LLGMRCAARTDLSTGPSNCVDGKSLGIGSMDWTDGTRFALATLSLLMAGVVKGTTGVGYASCALPLLVAALGLKTAIGVVVIPAMLSNFVLMLNTGRLPETLRRFWPLYAATLPGIAIGTSTLVWIDPAIATQLLGILTVLYTLVALTRPTPGLASGLERALQVPVGFFNGIFTGLTGSQMMPLLPYMLALKLDADRFVQANNVAVTLASAFLAMTLLASGMMTWHALELSFAGIVPAVVGVELGTRVRRLIPAAVFRIIILVLLLAMGILLALRM
jgi:uncharacterized protein